MPPSPLPTPDVEIAMTTTLPSVLDGAFLTREDHEAFVRVLNGESADAIEVRPLAMGARPMRVRSQRDAAELERVLGRGMHVAPVPLHRLSDAPVIVHLGCGGGYLLARLAYAHPSARLIGLEPDDATAGTARANLAGMNMPGEIVNAHLGELIERVANSNSPCTHTLASLWDHVHGPVVDALFVAHSVSAAAAATASPRTLARVRSARVHAIDAPTARQWKEAFDRTGLVCVQDQWVEHGVLAWSREVARLRPRYPVNQDQIDPGPGLW